MEQATSEDLAATEHERTMRFLLSWPVVALDNRRQVAGDASTTSERRGQVLASLAQVAA
jgi:hypothetical protein